MVVLSFQLFLTDSAHFIKGTIRNIVPRLSSIRIKTVVSAAGTSISRICCFVNGLTLSSAPSGGDKRVCGSAESGFQIRFLPCTGPHTLQTGRCQGLSAVRGFRDSSSTQVTTAHPKPMQRSEQTLHRRIIHTAVDGLRLHFI